MCGDMLFEAGSIGPTVGRDDTEAENGNNFTQLSHNHILESVISSFRKFKVKSLVHALTLIVYVHIYIYICHFPFPSLCSVSLASLTHACMYLIHTLANK